MCIYVCIGRHVRQDVSTDTNIYIQSPVVNRKGSHNATNVVFVLLLVDLVVIRFSVSRLCYHATDRYNLTSHRPRYL